MLITISNTVHSPPMPLIPVAYKYKAPFLHSLEGWRDHILIVLLSRPIPKNLFEKFPHPFLGLFPLRG